MQHVQIIFNKYGVGTENLTTNGRKLYVQVHNRFNYELQAERKEECSRKYKAE